MYMFALGVCVGGLRWGFALGVCVGGLRWGFALGVMQILAFALGVMQILAFALGVMQILASLDTNMLVSPTQNSRIGGIAQHDSPT